MYLDYSASGKMNVETSQTYTRELSALSPPTRNVKTATIVYLVSRMDMDVRVFLIPSSSRRAYFADTAPVFPVCEILILRLALIISKLGRIC